MAQKLRDEAARSELLQSRQREEAARLQLEKSQRAVENERLVKESHVKFQERLEKYNFFELRDASLLASFAKQKHPEIDLGGDNLGALIESLMVRHDLLHVKASNICSLFHSKRLRPRSLISFLENRRTAKVNLPRPLPLNRLLPLPGPLVPSVLIRLLAYDV